MDPMLKWVGSKRWLVPTVRQAWSGERIVELFAGGAAVTFGLDPERALLNDANPHLINFYRQVQQAAPFDFEFNSSEALYYDYRTWFNRLIREARCSTADAAQLFYYLNHHGFNGLFRVNSKGEFNVPFRPGRSCPPLDITTASEVMLEWEFTNDDFADVLLEPEDLVFADPPYDGTFNDYTSQGWSRERAEELAVLLRAHPGRVIMTNSATEWVQQLYSSLGYHLTLLASRQRMHQAQGRNDSIPELMATNFTVDLPDKIEP